jgi:hypothetical protein
MSDEIYVGAAGLGVLTGYERAYGGGPVGFGDDLVPPPAARPPSGPPMQTQLPGTVPVLARPPSETMSLSSLMTGENALKAVVAVAAFAFVYEKFFKKSREELAANDDDDGEQYERNRGSSSFMRPYSRNGSDEDDEEEDEDDEDEDDEDDEEEDDKDDDFAMNASRPDLTPNVTKGYKERTQQILANIAAIQKKHGG